MSRELRRRIHARRGHNNFTYAFTTAVNVHKKHKPNEYNITITRIIMLRTCAYGYYSRPCGVHIGIGRRGKRTL